MAQKILIKRSAVPGKVPLTTDLQYGEIAVNTHDGKAYFKAATDIDNDSDVSILEIGSKLTNLRVTGAAVFDGNVTFSSGGLDASPTGGVTDDF